MPRIFDLKERTMAMFYQFLLVDKGAAVALAAVALAGKGQ